MKQHQQPRHLRNLTMPFIIGACLLLGLKGGPWWQIGMILFGMELFDLSWHSRQHHPELWLARPVVWILGCILVMLVIILGF